VVLRRRRHFSLALVTLYIIWEHPPSACPAATVPKSEALRKTLNQTHFLHTKFSKSSIHTQICRARISFHHLAWSSLRIIGTARLSLHPTSISHLSPLLDLKEAHSRDFTPESPSPSQTSHHHLISQRQFPDAHPRASCSARPTFRPTLVHQCTAL
jgi:hypothetical protein